VGNILATLGLYAAFVVPFLAFAVLPARHALCVAFLGGSLLFPERIAFVFQGLPEMGKYELITLGSLSGALLFHAGSFRPARWFRGPELIVLLMLPAAFATALLNGDRIPGSRSSTLSAYDGLSLGFFDLTYMGIPFLLGVTFFRAVRDLRFMMLAFVVAGLATSLFVLFEAWYSPQLHNLVYGYLQHSWLQLMRMGGWRPMGFLPHGLAMSLFIGACLIAATSGSRIRARVGPVTSGQAAVWLGAMLLLCRSLGAILQAALFVPAAALLRRTTQLRLAWILSIVVVCYPVLRAVDVFPTGLILDTAEVLDARRAQSLAFRFENEDRLAIHAGDRPLFGWGGFGRSKAVGDGGPKVVVDGFWINRYSARGIAGFLIYIGLLVLPVRMAYRARRDVVAHPEGAWLCGAALILTMHAVDTLPNALFTHYPLVLAGALTQVARRLPDEVAAREKTAEDRPEGPNDEAPPPEGGGARSAEGRPMADLLTGRGRGRGPRPGES
jgi:hypothetical protein